MSRPANTAHFTLHIPTVHNDFKVLAFDGTEAVSSLYGIHVELISENHDFDLESLLGQPAFCSSALKAKASTVASKRS